MTPEQLIALDRTVERALSCLPDGMSERKAALRDLLTIAPVKSKSRAIVAGLLHDLLTVERNTERAQLKFEQLRSGNTPAR